LSDKNKFRKKFEGNNKIAASVISISGYGVILSIVALFAFLLYETIPLFYSASVTKTVSVPSNKNSKIIFGDIDSYKELFYSINEKGIVSYYNVKEKINSGNDTIPLLDNEKIILSEKSTTSIGRIAIVTDMGRIINIKIGMRSDFVKDKRNIVPTFEIENNFNIYGSNKDSSFGISNLSYDISSDGNKFWSWLDNKGNLYLKIFNSDSEQFLDYNLSKQTSTFGLTALIIDTENELLIVGNNSGELFSFDISDPEDVTLKGNWKSSNNKITKLAFLIGGNTLIVGDSKGEVESWFQTRGEDNQLHFSPINKFKKHNSAVAQIIASPRNRSFLTIGENSSVHLNFSTTSTTELEFKMNDHSIVYGTFTPKSDGIILVDNKNNLGVFNLDDKHPDVTLNTLFNKVQYEGYNEPEFVWQSTGGSDSFESKFSLIPLIFGTLKGTFFAMLFSIPIALLGAIFVSQFSSKKLAKIVKPTIEIMAALPSVVIGFLAGLFFSSLFEQNLMLIFSLSLFGPLLMILGISFFGFIPERIRRNYPSWVDIAFVFVLMCLVYIIVSTTVYPLEHLFFNGNLKQWLYSSLSVTYDQRNSMVVGFALGFAVIPIIFTITEDALSNVPKSLSSASLALGASKWQTVKKVVLPAAAGGIFAAVMLGLGRAIGETMIVLMATGNTPILDLSPFNGFRALSANIAVEIPEAPVDGTLYRILFFTSLLLLTFTFIINTIATFIGDKLRKKYARF